MLAAQWSWCLWFADWCSHVNDRRPSFQCRWQQLLGLPFTQLQQHCNELAGFVNCFQDKAPMHQPSFSRRARQVQGRCEQLLRANGLAGDPTHPGFTSRTSLSGNRSEKTLELGPHLTMQQDDKHTCLTVTRKPPSQEAPLRLAKRLLLMGPKATLIRLYSH